MLQQGCDSCSRHVQIDVHPVFADKLIWEGTKLVFWAVPVAGPLNLGKVMSFMELAGAWDKGLVQFAAKGAGMVFAKGVDQVTKPMIDPIASHYGGSVVGKMVERVIRGPDIPPAYAFRVTEISTGTLTRAGTTVTFTSHLTEAFRGVSLTQGWTSTRTTTLTEMPALGYKPPSLNPIPRESALPSPLRQGTLVGVSPDAVRALTGSMTWHDFSRIIGPTTNQLQPPRIYEPRLQISPSRR